MRFVEPLKGAIMSVAAASSSIVAGRRNLIAVCQLTSQHNVEENFEHCARLIAHAGERKCKMVFLPECFDFIARSKEESLSIRLSANEGDFIPKFRELARTHGLWLALGGFHNSPPPGRGNDLPKNTYLVLDERGETRASYDKLHLFDLEIPGKVRLIESETYQQGEKLVPPVETPIGRLGMSICYDVRFPELSRFNRERGAEILSFPSSFTLNTGLAHWETLLRSRAIENQCYVVAAAQTGRHNDKRISYGHSMVVDPWGAVIAQCSERVDICFAEIDLDYVHEIRELQPLEAHRRRDLYSLIFNDRLSVDRDPVLMFGPHPIPAETIFYRSGLSFAFVNLKPVLPGHVLVSPLRQAHRLTQLTDQETADLFIVARKVQTALEKHFGVESTTLCVQDGPDAGQTVKHVHVHVVPRSTTDFRGEVDKFYEALQNHEKDLKPRTLEEMIAEATIYRNLMELNKGGK